MTIQASFHDLLEMYLEYHPKQIKLQNKGFQKYPFFNRMYLHYQKIINIFVVSFISSSPITIT